MNVTNHGTAVRLVNAVRYQRKLERSWRADVKSKDKWAAFDKQRKITQVIIKKREREYYHLLFTEKASNPKEVFNITNALLARKTSVLFLNVHPSQNWQMTSTNFLLTK